MGKPSSPPPAPDYTGAAQATASGNLDATRAAAAANRVNQYTPYGNLIYSQDPNATTPDNGWSQTINLSPTGQALLDASNQTQLGLSQNENTLLNRVDNTLSQPFTTNAQGAVNQAYGDITSRLDPQWAQSQTSEETKLTNEGLNQNDAAWQNDMRNFNQAKNDAYNQANLTAMNYAPTEYQMDLSTYNQPLNELSAIMSGSQVTNPQFSSVPPQQPTSGPNYLGAAQATGQYNTGVYNAQQVQQGNFLGGLFGLGGSLLGAAGNAGGFAPLFEAL